MSIARWDSQQGKGLDDLIVNASRATWEAAYADALPLSQWQILQRLERQLTYPINLRVNLGDLSQLDPAQVPSEGMIALCSPKGTGKTKLIAALLTDQERVLSLTHRIALGRNLGFSTQPLKKVHSRTRCVSLMAKRALLSFFPPAMTA